MNSILLPSKPAPNAQRPLLRCAAFFLIFGMFSGCQYINEQVTMVRIKVLGIEVCEPDKESAEWVLMEVLKAMNKKDSEAGWERFQKMLHSKERNPNSLRGWNQMGWRRMRKQKDHYLNEDGCYKIVKLRKVESTRGELQGVEYYLESKKKDMGTPCSVYKDEDNKGKWRIKRCSL